MRCLSLIRTVTVCDEHASVGRGHPPRLEYGHDVRIFLRGARVEKAVRLGRGNLCVANYGIHCLQSLARLQVHRVQFWLLWLKHTQFIQHDGQVVKKSKFKMFLLLQYHFDERTPPKILNCTSVLLLAIGVILTL